MTVLLIDDDEDDVLFFEEALRDLVPNSFLRCCSCAEEALLYMSHATSEMPDVIFLDINMPVINGWECLREIKKIAGWEMIPVVMYSTADLSKSGMLPTDVGAAGFYKKGNSFSELKDSLRQALGAVFK